MEKKKINITWSESWMDGCPLKDIEDILNSAIEEFVTGELLSAEVVRSNGTNRFWIYSE